jgi:uncharacterized membrane protein HdeD (DUF308 family)
MRYAPFPRDKEALMTTNPAIDRPSDNFPVEPGTMHRILAQNWWTIALRGVLGIVFGIIALAFPLITILSLVLLFSAYSLVDGALLIMAAIRAATKGGRWGFLLLQGITSAAAGVVAFFWPGLTVVAFILVIAVWAIVSGSLMLAAAYRSQAARGRGWIVFGGLVSLAYGVLLILTPLIGAVVLTWWLGAYSLVFGIALVVFAFRLKPSNASEASR